ncbi:hypothetical protein [Bradyrhizobium canariense]|uniref:Uncharacterized protein n=1 Tax=Bradyrhizobium canariense TaxID=255045 RepID=A0A1H1WBG4_9BRAD|nr:hypothetical protein [Bradyrhizobium canariense]SDS94424.1 hypothetical protein SAMN05444158_3775 [Bradyrhizobium canariense]
MHQAANLPFERIVHEFAQWRAVPEDERSQAPAWWWGPAFEVLGMHQPMPSDWCSSLGLPNGSAFTSGADVLLETLADQTTVSRASDFLRKKDKAG